jgi:hypothetical protein
MPSNTSKFSSEKSLKEKHSHGLGITIFSAIILVVIIVTFIGAPVVSKISEQPSVTFGTYDGVPIDFVQGNAFARHVEQLNRFYEQFNQGSSNIDLQRQMVWRQAFEQTTIEIALKHEAELAGIVVTDGQIDKALVSNENYQKDGKFSEELYRSTASADRFRYRQETKTDLLVRQLAMDQTQAPMLSGATKDFIASLAYPQRKFSFVTFTDADYPQELVSEYAVKNKALFRTIDVSKITLTSSEGDAVKVHDEAVKGDKGFADLAKAYSKDTLAESGGTLGVRRYYELKAEITNTADLDKIFTLAKGAISNVIKGDKTWTIYKVNVPAQDADLASADTLAVVRAYIGRSDRGLLEDNLEAKAKVFADSVKNDFAAAAKKIGKTVSTTGWVGLNFGNHDLFPSVSEASKDPLWRGLASNEEFFRKAFRLGVGQISTPILASPSVLVVKVDEVKSVPAAEDKPVLPSAVDAEVSKERSQELQQQTLTSPKFKDQFQSEFSRLFPVR